MWSAKYRAYGNLAALDASEIDNPLGFQGQYFDAETGLHYNRHCYYNPGTGRFLTPDPIKLAGGLNSYQYVPNPTGWVDPLGLASKDCEQPEPYDNSAHNAAKYAAMKRDLRTTEAANPLVEVCDLPESFLLITLLRLRLLRADGNQVRQSTTVSPVGR